MEKRKINHEICVDVCLINNDYRKCFDSYALFENKKKTYENNKGKCVLCYLDFLSCMRFII